MREVLDYLSGSPLTRDPTDLDRLFQTILDRRTAIVIGSLWVCAVAIVVMYTARVWWPAVWIALEIVLTIMRWHVMTKASHASQAQRLTYRNTLSLLTLAWSLVFGWAIFLCLLAPATELIVIACTLMMTVAGVVTSRNAATPRNAYVAILILAVPFLLGLVLTPHGASWVAAIISIPWVASLYAITRQNHSGLVRLIKAERRANRLANTDELTGLYNRAGFSRHRDALLERRDYAYLSVDFDGFKLVNDRLGHAAGDELLQMAAERMRGCIRKDDLIFRIGGDEFVIFLPNASIEDCTSIAGRLIEELSYPFTLHDNPEVRIGASIGSACYGGVTTEPSAILKAADKALYQAKEAGRGKHVHFRCHTLP